MSTDEPAASPDRPAHWREAYNQLCSDLAYLMDMDDPSIAGDRQVKERVARMKQEHQDAGSLLSHATQFAFPHHVTVSRWPLGHGWRISWPDPDAPGDWRRFHPMTEDREELQEAVTRAWEVSESLGRPLDSEKETP